MNLIFDAKTDNKSKICFYKKSAIFTQSSILVTTGVFRIRKGKRFPQREFVLYPPNFSTFHTPLRSVWENCGKIVWIKNKSSPWKSFPLPYPENSSGY